MAEGLDVSEIMKRAVQANAKFYKGWMDLSLEYFKSIAGIVGGPGETVDATPEMDSGTNALILEAEAGQVARGSFLVTNDLERVVSCAFMSADFKDHTGEPARTAVKFDPPAVQLAAGEQRVVEVAIAVDDALVPGVGYAGEFSIKGMDGFAVPVVLRRQHSVGEVPTAVRTPAPSGPVSRGPGKRAGAAVGGKPGARAKRR